MLEAVKEMADAWELQEVLQEEGVSLLQVGIVPWSTQQAVISAVRGQCAVHVQQRDQALVCLITLLCNALAASRGKSASHRLTLKLIKVMSWRLRAHVCRSCSSLPRPPPPATSGVTCCTLTQAALVHQRCLQPS